MNENLKQYYKKMREPVVYKTQKMTKIWLLKHFKITYLQQYGVNYSQEKESVSNLMPLVYYFLGDLDKFKACENVKSEYSVPSLKKGLLIIGGFGNGKTSVMESFEVVLRHSNIPFKGFSANEIVTSYESLKSPQEKKDFMRMVNHGTRFFDDVKTERVASNYGKVELFKDIIETRCSNGSRTYITCNYKSDSPGNLLAGLQEFGERYGGRVHDRLFEMFNIVEFYGKSFRK